MTPVLTPTQLLDLTSICTLARESAAEVVIIGAVALLCFMDDLDRFTRDIDIAIALDLEEFSDFSTALRAIGWIQESVFEHRWLSPNGTLIDLLPAGPKLRAARKIVWPQSQFHMTLSGFDHVFAQSQIIDLGHSVHLKVARLPVIFLLKIAAYLDDPHRRAKDLDDLKLLLKHYSAKSDRIFSTSVFDADLDDIEYANAFLLGCDLNEIATPDDVALLSQFCSRFLDEQIEDHADAFRDPEPVRFQKQLTALRQGMDL